MHRDTSTRLSWTPRTLAAQALGRIDETTRAVVPPVHLATTYIRDPDNQYRSGNVYGRPDNETVRQAEAVIACPEGAAAAMVLGSGMSAATAVFLALSPGDHVVAPKVMYWSLRNWLVAEGTRRIYALETGPLREVDDWLGGFRRFWDQRLDALDTEVARGKRARRGA